MQAFRDYYFEQRHLQLMSDLTPPGSMLENHRAYLTHIAGARNPPFTPLQPWFIACRSIPTTVKRWKFSLLRNYAHYYVVA